MSSSLVDRDALLRGIDHIQLHDSLTSSPGHSIVLCQGMAGMTKHASEPLVVYDLANITGKPPQKNVVLTAS